MSKATCITDQIGFLWQRTCKHSLKSSTETQFCNSKKTPHILGWGLIISPATSVGPHLLPTILLLRHHICLGRYLLPKSWGFFLHGCKGLSGIVRQFSHELPMTDPWEGVPLRALLRGFCHGRRYQHSRDPYNGQKEKHQNEASLEGSQMFLWIFLLKTREEGPSPPSPHVQALQ